MVRARANPGDVERLLLETAARDGRRVDARRRRQPVPGSAALGSPDRSLATRRRCREKPRFVPSNRRRSPRRRCPSRRAAGRRPPRWQAVNQLGGDPFDDTPAGPVGHAIDPDYKAARRQPAKVVVPLDQDGIGAGARRCDRRGGAGRSLRRRPARRSRGTPAPVAPAR